MKKGSATMSDDAKTRLARDIDTGQKSLQRDSEDFEADVQQEEGRIMQDLGQKMMDVIIKYATANSYAMVVDVSKPERPNLLKRTAQPNQATAGNLAMVSPDVAIAEMPEKKPNTLTSSNHPTETVRVLDLSDPRNPKTLQEFSGVTSILPDGIHGLIYLTNNEGLWILQYNRRGGLDPAKKKPPCDSYSAIMSMPPDCD